MEVLAQRGNWTDEVEFAVYQKDGGNIHAATELAMEKMKCGQITNPTFFLTNSATQQLFNQLWNMGFRPADGTGNSGHIEALSNHLQDMRRLVFHEPIVVEGEKYDPK